MLICALWLGYFVLEGFDFGVGMLLPTLGRDRTEKRMIIHTIGPVWDGNEVWLVVAGAATFAAFPVWYASLFSGFYLALFLILAALIVRGVSFEFWGKDDSPRWRGTWEWTAAIGSGLAALLWGVGWANIVHGVAMDSQHNVTASLLDLLHPYALLGGLVTLSLFLGHGAMFLALRTRGDLAARALGVASRASLVSVVLLAGFLVWTGFDQRTGGTKLAAQILAAGSVALAAAVPALLAGRIAAGGRDDAERSETVRRRDGWAFALSAGAIVLLFASLFVDLFPNALPSATASANDLTLIAASSSHYALTVMTVVAVILIPLVLAYQAWTYWVFRHRLGRDDFEGTPTPMAVLSQIPGLGIAGASPGGGRPAPAGGSGDGSGSAGAGSGPPGPASDPPTPT